MKCPYDNSDCTEIDTSGMTMLKNCKDCQSYNNGVSATGATPVLAWIVEQINKICSKIKSYL